MRVKTDNAAFEDDPRPELARILRRVAQQIEDGDEHRTVFDSNGNPVGDWVLR